MLCCTVSLLVYNSTYRQATAQADNEVQLIRLIR